jgi:hypothetical protein
MLRARERDIREAQVLAALLGLVLALVGREVGAVHADVDDALVAGLRVVEEDRLGIARDVARLPQVGVVDDRELDALAAMDGEDLDGLGVGLEAPAALLVARVLAGRGDLLAQPRGQRGGAHLLGRRGGVQELADVAQVGQLALAVDGPQHPLREALDQRHGLGQRGDALHAQDARPLVQAAVELLAVLLGGRRDPLRRPAQEGRERGRGGPCRRRRPFDRFEQAQPVARRGGAEDAARAVDDGGDVDLVEGVADERGVAVGSDEDGDVAGANALGLLHRAVLGADLDLRVGGEQGGEVGREVLGDVLARALIADASPARELERRLVAMDDPDAQRRRDRRVEQARRLVGVGRPDPPVDDALVAELRAAQQRVVGVDEPLVAAPVDLEGRALVGAVGRLEVRVDVGAAEGIDRLFGVADEDERRVAVPEGAAHDVPLDGVGVLELVDEHDPVALSEVLRRGLAAGALERVVEAREEVVVGHDGHLALAAAELVADGQRQAAAHRLDGVPRRVLGLDAHGGVVDRDAGDAHRLRAVELGLVGPVPAPDVEVVDDVLEQVADVLDEGGVGVDVARDAQAAQHLLAEAVRGGDGGGVEVGQGSGEALAPLGDLLRRALRQQRHDFVLRGRTRQRAVEPLLGADQPLAHALAELAGGHAREGHEQELLERGALGDVARGERGDGERFPGPRARFEDGDPGRQRAADVERADVAGEGAHRSKTASVWRRPFQRRTE